MLRFKEWIITNLRVFGQRVILLIIPRTQILITFLPISTSDRCYFHCFAQTMKKRATEGGGRRINDAVEREKTAFLTDTNLVGPRSELMTRYNEPHAREHKDTPGWVRNHRKPTSHVHNCTRVRVWSKFATIVVVRARVQLFVSPLCHFGAWDRFNFGTI